MKKYDLIAGFCVAAGMLTSLAVKGEDLVERFRQPPASARPWVYWFWLNGNITREGITADLEAMHRVGIGGVLIMEVVQGTPQGPVRFGSPPWRDLFKHALEESHRLGMKVDMNNDPGWSGSGGPWITPDLAMQKVIWSEIVVQGPRRFSDPLVKYPAVANYYGDIAVIAFPTPALDYIRVDNVQAKAMFVKQEFVAQATYPKVPAEGTIDRRKVVNLTAKLGKHNCLTWDVPEGKWTILRIGRTTTGVNNVPAPPDGRGLECDKLSKEAVGVHFANLMGKLIAEVGPLAGKTLVSTHVDSWEVGPQNWTPRFREEFERRRGYDLLPFLPVMTGRVVDSMEVSERFLWDLRQTISDLLVENYAGHLRDLAHKHGMRLSVQAYDGCPCDDVAYAGQSDEPQAEFWSYPAYDMDWSCTEMASAAHVYGKRILSGEAFTADDTERWLGHPASLKALGDWAYCQGINRFVIHRYAHQPWLTCRPGVSMGPWGLHYERTQTWWEQSTAWHEYLSRCQYLLQQGLFVADICCLQPEGSPRSLWSATKAEPQSHWSSESGCSPYRFDLCTPEAVLTRMTVRDDRLVLPDGMSYRLLVLPSVETMTPVLLRKIKKLVEAGATVVGSRPLKSPSLAAYPHCDAEVKQLAAELWGDCDGKTVTEHRYGKGRVVQGKTAAEVLAAMGVRPDFEYRTKSSLQSLRYVHRTLDGTDVYFVANKSDAPEEAMCVFRVSGKRPELWWPETGRIERFAVYDEANGRVCVPIRFDRTDSVFVVFRPNAVIEPDRIISVARNGDKLLSADWKQAEAPHEGETAADKPDNDGFPVISLVRNEKGHSEAIVSQPGSYRFQSADGKSCQVEVASKAASLEIGGPWQLHFPAGGGAPERVVLDKLISWSDHGDPGVKYYSGAATYSRTIVVPAEMIGNDRRLFLDLGRVQVIAEVKLNGNILGILWKSPFRVDVTDRMKAGENKLEVKVVNLWPNRMIGDEQLPEDSRRDPNGNVYGMRGPILLEWPQWLLEGKSSPAGRHTFTTWPRWPKDAPLLESGLLGPVKLWTMPVVVVPQQGFTK